MSATKQALLEEREKEEEENPICDLCARVRIDPEISPEKKAAMSKEDFDELMFFGGECCKQAWEEDDMPGWKG